MKRFNIVVVSTNRADWLHCYAILNSLIAEFECSLVLIGDSEGVQDPEIQKWIEESDIRIFTSNTLTKHESFDEILSSVPTSISKISSQAVDLAIVFGDRLEMLIAALCLFKDGIKIAHIAGGETSLGSLDETYRSIITSISNYHFPLTEEGRLKLLRQGVENDQIFRIGAPSLDLIPIQSK
jgi:UDP-N-acetylglucosamine 2-epimerase